MGYTLIHNEEKKCFQFEIDGHVPRIEYIQTKDEIYLTHTEVPKQLEGQGVGGALVAAALREVELLGKALVPLCPFVAMYIKRHPDWKRIVKKGIKQRSRYDFSPSLSLSTLTHAHFSCLSF